MQTLYGQKLGIPFELLTIEICEAQQPKLWRTGVDDLGVELLDYY